MKVFFVSLGCDKNLVDSERMLGHLADRYFGSSFRNMVSFLVDKKNVTLEDLESLTKAMEE